MLRRILYLVLFVSLAFGIRAYAFEAFRAPSEAMVPTLLVGDHFFVSKLGGESYEPQRGDVVVFTVARDPSGKVFPRDEALSEATEKFVKRVIGVPGDVIDEVGGEIRVNGVVLVRTPSGESYVNGMGESAVISEEQIGDKRYRVAHVASRPPIRFETTQVPPDRYFLLGDFRTQSNDSRFWGSVAREDIQGPVSVIYWPGASSPDGSRWGRIGSVR